MTAFDKIDRFEKALGEFTGAPYVVMTDCCTHAIELCMLYDLVEHCEFTAFTYLSIPMIMHKLEISYRHLQEEWIGEYRFHGTRIWDSARLLKKGMYRPGMKQCLSFGYDKPLHLGRGGAIILDDAVAYKHLIEMRSDGRDLSISPWETQKEFRVGYHYRPTIEEAIHANIILETYAKDPQPPKYHQYPDLRNIVIRDKR